MTVKTQNKLNFSGIDILSVKFQSIHPYDQTTDIDLSVIPKLFLPKGSVDNFNIIMEVEVKAENFFSLEILAVGAFEFDPNIEESLRQVFMHQNAAAILFPYVRSFISTFSANLGISTGTLTLPPQMFKGPLSMLNDEDSELTEEPEVV